MAIEQPIATDKQNSPDHSLSHRVIANDAGASATTIVASTGGKVGIGVDAPSASLHIKAGDTPAGSAPLKFTAGALLATPEAGSIEFNDGRFYITGTAKQRVIDRTCGVLTSTVTVASTSTQTTIYSETLSANGPKVGRIYKIHCDGIASNVANSDDISFYVYMGTNLLATYAPTLNTYASSVWKIDFSFTIRAVGTSPTGQYASHGEISLATFSSIYSTLGAMDTTVANDIHVQVKWSASKAGNTISIYQGYLELKN
jgi:hypothetical protein